MSTNFFCDQCGVATSKTATTCTACGADLPIFREAERESKVKPVITLLKPSVKYWPFVAAALGIALLAPSARGVGGQRSLDWTALLLLSLPLIAGWVVSFIQSGAVSRQIDRFEGWMAQHREANRNRDGGVSRWALRPMFWMFTLIATSAARLPDSHIRVGIKFAAYFYFALIVLYLAIMATMLFLLLVALAIAGFIISLFDSSRDGRNPEREPVDKPRRTPPVVGPKGATIIKGTNFFNKSETGRVDSDGRIYEGTNILNEKWVGRIDKSGNVYEGTNIFNESQLGRIDDRGDIHRGTNLFNDEWIGRIDSEGNVYEGTNLFNEKEVGRVEKKK